MAKVPGAGNQAGNQAESLEESSIGARCGRKILTGVHSGGLEESLLDRIGEQHRFNERFLVSPAVVFCHVKASSNFKTDSNANSGFSAKANANLGPSSFGISNSNSVLDAISNAKPSRASVALLLRFLLLRKLDPKD